MKKINYTIKCIIAWRFIFTKDQLNKFLKKKYKFIFKVIVVLEAPCSTLLVAVDDSKVFWG